MMGCHTWFKRLLSDDEFHLMKEYAPSEIKELTLDCMSNLYDLGLYNLLMKSYNENIPCVYGKYWYELGYGSGNPKFNQIHGNTINVSVIEGKLFVDLAFDANICENKYGMKINDFNTDNEIDMIDFPYFHDIFRIKNYPKKVIHNKRELRKYLRKRYFELTEYQLNRISKFFELYPGGVITFG